jgi:hypothetical protein
MNIFKDVADAQAGEVPRLLFRVAFVLPEVIVALNEVANFFAL